MEAVILVLIWSRGCGWGGGWVAAKIIQFYLYFFAVVCLELFLCVCQWSGGSDSHGVG
jgi:hypothetical protein